MVPYSMNVRIRKKMIYYIVVSEDTEMICFTEEM